MLLVSFALAAQPGSASLYNGTYDLTCADAALSIHLGAVGQVGGASGGWGTAGTLPLDCDGIDASDLEVDTADACVDAGFGVPECESFAAALADGVEEFNEGAVSLLPESVAFTVSGTSNWLYRWLGIYPMTGLHTWSDGTTASWGYWLNNNVGSSEGDFATAALSVLNAASTGTVACADVAIGAIAGNIDNGASYALDADFGVDRAIYCLVVSSMPSDWFLASVGLTFDGSMTGTRL